MDYLNFSSPVFIPKETKATAKERPNLLVEEKAESYYGLKTMAKKLNR